MEETLRRLDAPRLGLLTLDPVVALRMTARAVGTPRAVRTTRVAEIVDRDEWTYHFKAGFGSELRYWVPYHDLVFRPRLYRLARAVETWALPKAWQLRARFNH